MSIDWHALTTPILLEGDARTAYRDPAAVFYDGVFHLFYTYALTEDDGRVFLYTATSRSTDLVRWTPPQTLTPRDQGLNFSSPGNVVRRGEEWILCLQTYPTPNGEKYGNGTARLWTMRSRDLERWSPPELLRVKGPDVPVEAMGRMIDPYLLEDRDRPGTWWCFYKQNGVSFSRSDDLERWTFVGSERRVGENVCLFVEGGEYVMVHSPEKNGIGIMRSRDLVHWRETAMLTLGQAQWPWARGRITAGFVLDLRHEPQLGKYVMFFHGTGPEDESVIFNTHACIGVAWSDDFVVWEWPGMQ